jgi:hypothetical protein
MRQVLEAAGLRRAGAARPTDGDFIQVHFNYQPESVIIDSWTGPVIIARRERALVEDSWRRRGKPMLNFEGAWAKMEEFLSRELDDVMFIDIDNPETREAQLQAISDWIGVPLTADFSVKVGHQD